MKLNNRDLLRLIFAIKGNFRGGIKPEPRMFDGVEVMPFQDGAEACVTISADFELNWAWRMMDRDEMNFRGNQERNNFRKILRLADSYGIPITWATVGHLFLEDCRRDSSGLAHAHMPRPPRTIGWEGDWYRHDPCTSLKKDPLWYAPDLVESIIKSKVPHEIATHSFSHIDFSPGSSTREVISAEIEACVEAMERFRIRPKSLVFPYNKMGYENLETISTFGIKAVRHRDKKVRLSYPERTGCGVYKIYESMNTRSATHYDYAEKAKIFIEAAKKRNAVYHLWFHPSDDLRVFEKELQEILRHVGSEREKGLIWVTTMDKLVSYVEARKKVALKVERNDRSMNIVFERHRGDGDCDNAPITLKIPIRGHASRVYVKENGEMNLLESHKVRSDPNTGEAVISASAMAEGIQIDLDDKAGMEQKSGGDKR